MKVLYITILLFVLVGCGIKKPHGMYTGTLDMGSSKIVMRYDFRENREATFIITSDVGSLAARGHWRMEKGKIIFEGTQLDDPNNTTYDSLEFDGKDLFRDDLAIRFKKE